MSDKYDCTMCPGYCCVVFGDVGVSDADALKLARFLGIPLQKFLRKYTKKNSEGERILRRKYDSVLKEKACTFLDLKTRRCTVYERRPHICRGFPYRDTCGFYDMLKFTREHCDDQSITPLIQLENHWQRQT